MKSNKKLIHLINKKAAKLSAERIAKAEKRADDAEKDYLKQNEKREKIYKKKIEYCHNLKEKTEAECRNLLAGTQRECDEMLAKARGIMKESLKHFNEICKDQQVIDKFYKLAQSLQANADDYRKRAKHSAQLTENLLKKIDNGRGLRQ